MDDRYGSGLKGLNISGGGNRFKFEGKEARAKRVDVDVAHKVRAEGFLDLDKAQEPEVEGGSFFQQELDRCKELNVTSPFKRFYYKVWPLVQSLAELVHHSPTIVDMLLALLEDPAVVAQAGEETLQLISVLGRDLQSSFFPYFPRVSAALIALVADSDVAPEKCGKVLRCLGYLLKFVARPLSNDMNAARALYAPLLGHRKDFARKMAAQSLAPAVRRLKPKAMRRHAKQLVGALAAGSVATGVDGARLRADTLDGCSQLLFFVVKGVQGRTHSQAPVLLRVLLDSILPPKAVKSGSGEAGKGDAKVGQNGVERAWCFELASAVLGHLVEHIRSPNSAELWLELHYGVGTAMARYRASMTAADLLVKDCGIDEEDPGCAGIRRTVDLLSQAVGHMGGILLREQAIGVKQAGLLAEVLAELAAPDVFWHSRTSPGCRKAIVELLSVSLRGLHQRQRLVKVMPRITRAVVSAPSGDGQPPPAAIAPSVQEIHPALVLSQSFLGIGAERSHNVPPMRVMREVVVRPLLEACAGPLSQQTDIVLEIMLRLVHGTGVGLAFAGPANDRSNRGVRETLEGDGATSEVDGLDEDGGVGDFTTVAGVTCVGGLSFGISATKKLLDICADCVESAISSLEGLDRRESAALTAKLSKFSRAVAALRCLPILVGSSMFTEDARREAVSRPLRIIERLIALCSTPENDGEGTTSVQCGKTDATNDKGVERRGAKDGVSVHEVVKANGAGDWNDRDEVVVLRAYALEAGLSLRCFLPSDEGSTESQDIQEKLMSWHNRAMGWLRARPASIATLRAVALLLRVIRDASPAVGHAPSCLSAEASLPIMDLLELNLASESRLLRLSTMRVLVRYDPLRCDTGAHLTGSAMNSSSINSGDATCNFFEVAEALEALPISIAAERDLMWRLEQLEVLGRSECLPRPYARLMATHALGLLRVKFSGVWPKAAAIVTALCQRSVDQRELVWGPLHKALRQVMPPPPSSPGKALESPESLSQGSVDPRSGPQLTVGEADAKVETVADGGEVESGDRGREGRGVDLERVAQGRIPSSTALSAQLRKTLAAAAPRPWVPRLLSDATALDAGPTAKVDLSVVLEGVFLDKAVRSGLQPDSGEVPLWASTDADSAFAQVWGVLSQCPEILQKHSRTIVPLFLGFMQYQFLGNDAFPDDPEVRALKIERHLTPAERASEGPGGWGPVVRWEGELPAAAMPHGGQDKTGVEAFGRTADRRSVRGRLFALLGVFASANGPKSLYKQRVLYRVYRALLVMPDDKIAGLALRCMLSYKPPFLMPYKTSLAGLMNEESFRNELVTFSLRSEGDGGSGKSESGGRGEVSIPFSAPTSGATALDDGPAIDPLHRPGLLPVVIRLVYGRLSAGAGSRVRAGGGRGGPAARRAAVLAFLSGLCSEELVELFALMIRPFLPPEESSAHGTSHADRDTLEEGPADWNDITGEAAQARRVLDKAVGMTPSCLERISASRKAGFLKMVKEVARQLGQRVLPYVERLLRLVLTLLEHSNAISEADRRVSGGETRRAQAGEDEAEVEDDEAVDKDDLALTSGAIVLTSTVRSSHSKGKIAPGALRALCLRALSEFFSKFASSFDFASHQDALWPALTGPIERLPASTIGAGKAPALLTLAETIAESEALLPMLSCASGKGGEALVPAVLDCISAGASGGRVAGPAVVGSALSFVERVLRYDEGRLLAPHLNRLISNFGARFSVTGMSAKGTGGAGGLDSHSEQGLAILARVAEMATLESLSLAAAPDGRSDVIDPSSMSELLALLVPSLHPDRRASDEAKSSILRTVSALAPRVDVPGARRAWPMLSNLLGPAGPRPSGLAAAGPRNELVRSLKALASRPDLATYASPAISILTDLNARESVALDEPDFRRVVPAYNSLSEGTGWADVVTSGCSECGVKGEVAAPLGGMLVAAPVARHCFHSMHDQEVAVRGAAAAALKRLARDAVAARKKPAKNDDPKRCPWEGLMRTVVMPSLRTGMACRTEIVRKGYISLLRETLSAYQTVQGDADSKAVVSSTNDSASMIPSDLWILARADDPESDFFMNACHLQIHRRARALAKARKAIEDSEVAYAAAAAASAAGTAITASSAEIEDQGFQSETKNEGAPPKCPFRVSTLVHFLLPLALHPLHEASKATEVGLVDQAIQLIGAVARHLPWTHYNSALRGLMQQVTNRGAGSDSPEQERAMINALCGVLDGFHFALIPPPAESSAPSRPYVADGAPGRQDKGNSAVVEGDAVWRAVNGRLLASLRALLTKEVRGKAGEKEKVLRAPVALGLMKLVRRLPADSFGLELQPLLMTVCQSLKSRDSNARDTARGTLAKMACDLGPEYLHQIITELRTCLVTGYQLHVRTFTLHTILKRVADSYVPPNPPSVDIRSGSLTSGAPDRDADGVIVAAPKMKDASIAEQDGEMDVDEEAPVGAGDRVKVVPAIPSSLVRPPFDACIPQIVELLMDDLFGEIAAAKEAQGANVASSKMKEAKGQKANDSFEIVARTLLFRPTFTVLSPEDVTSVSSVHALVGPVLKRLEGCESARDVGKAGEVLARIGIGLAVNPSVTESEMLLYVHATVAPFLLPQTSQEKEGDGDAEERDSDESSDSDAGEFEPHSRKRGGKRPGSSSSARKWITSEVNAKDQSRGAAVGEKRRREWESVQVLDGASAPKHTGRDRHDGRAAGRLRPGTGSSLSGGGDGSGRSNRGVNLSDPAALGAVTLALGLLQSRLKAEATARGSKRATTMDKKVETVRAMADPFVPLLARCIGRNPHTPVVLLSLKSLCYLLRWNLPSMGRCAPIIARHVLARLVRGGVGGIRGEMGQTCFKALTTLFKSQVQVFGVDGDAVVNEREGGVNSAADKDFSAPRSVGAKREGKGGRRSNLFGLSTKQLRALLVVLQMAVAEMEHQNATFTLIKVVVSRKVMLPEVYDLMTKLAELSVTSHHPNMRITAGQTFLTFLLRYPLGEKRLQFHLKQIVNGVSYEHAEGRLAALSLCSQLLRRLPEPKLDELASIFYLALVVRLVNDPASECRAAAAAATNILLKRVSGDIFHQLFDFTGQWFGGTVIEQKNRSENAPGTFSPGAEQQKGGADTQDAALRRTAAQASGIFVQARPELLWKGAGGRLPWLLSTLASMLPPRAADVIAATRNDDWGDASAAGGAMTTSMPGGCGEGSYDWEGVYHVVLSIGKAFEALPRACNAALSSWKHVAREGSVDGEEEASSTGDHLEMLFDRLLEALLYPHAWVRLAAARFWGLFFSKRHPRSLAIDGEGGGGTNSSESEGQLARVGNGEAHSGDSGKSWNKNKSSKGRKEEDGKGKRKTTVANDDGGQEFLRKQRVLFRLCQNFCSQLNRSQVDPRLTEQCVKNLVFIGRAMHLNPELCFAETPGGIKEETVGGDFSEEDGEGVEGTERSESGVSDGSAEDAIGNKNGDGSRTKADPLTWVFNRMSNMVVHKGEARRRAVFSWFAAMVAVHEPTVSIPHLRVMLLPLRRAVLDAEAGGVEADSGVSSEKGSASRQGGIVKEQTSSELATEVMELLESKVGSGVFLEALTGVNMEIARKRVERKRQRAVEKATDPAATAERRKMRMEAGKLRKRRKVEEKAKLRGGTKSMRMRAGRSGSTPSRGRGRGGSGIRGRGQRGKGMR